MLRLDARRAALASREVVQRDDRRHARLEPGASVEEALPGRRGRHERAQAQAIATPRARSEGQGVANSNYMPLQLPRSWPRCCIVAVARVRDAAAHYRHRSHLRAAWCWQGCRRSKQGRRPVRWCRRLRRAERHAQARGALAPLMPAPTAAHRTAAPLRCCAAARRCTPMQPLRRCTLLQPLRRCIPLHAAAQRCTHSPHALVSRSVPSAGAHAPTDAGAPLRGGAREEPAV